MGLRLWKPVEMPVTQKNPSKVHTMDRQNERCGDIPCRIRNISQQVISKLFFCFILQILFYYSVNYVSWLYNTFMWVNIVSPQSVQLESPRLSLPILPSCILQLPKTWMIILCFAPTTANLTYFSILTIILLNTTQLVKSLTSVLNHCTQVSGIDWIILYFCWHSSYS